MDATTSSVFRQLRERRRLTEILEFMTDEAYGYMLTGLKLQVSYIKENSGFKTASKEDAAELEKIIDSYAGD